MVWLILAINSLLCCSFIFCIIAAFWSAENWWRDC